MKKFMIDDYSLDFEAEHTKYIQRGLNTIAFAQKTIDADEADFLAK